MVEVNEILERKTMDVSKLKFDIRVSYDCAEGEGCVKQLDDGTYEQAVSLFMDLDSKTWWNSYYRYMSISVGVYEVGKDGEDQLDLEKILGGEYSWLADDYSTSDVSDAMELPKCCLDFLEALKNGEEWLGQKQIVDLKNKIKQLEWELDNAKKELADLEREQT